MLAQKITHLATELDDCLLAALQIAGRDCDRAGLPDGAAKIGVDFSVHISGVLSIGAPTMAKAPIAWRSLLAALLERLEQISPAPNWEEQIRDLADGGAWSETSKLSLARIDELCERARPAASARGGKLDGDLEVTLLHEGGAQ